MKSKLIFFLLLIVAQTFAQELDFSIKWGKEFNAPRKSSLVDIVGHDGSGIYAVKVRYRLGLMGGNDYTLEHYDNDYTPTHSLDLDIKEDGLNCDVLHILQLEGKLYIFYSCPQHNEKKNKLFVRELDKNTFQLKAAKLLLGEIDYAGKSRNNNGGFNFRVSRDSSKLLVYYNLPYNSNERESFGFHVLDSKMNSLWKKNVTLPYVDDLFDVESIRVDNAGNVYQLGLIYKDKRRSKRKGLPNYSYEVQVFTDKGNILKQYPVSLPDRFLTDMQIEILDKKHMICAGFYSELGTYSIKGTYFFYVDLETKDIKMTSFKEFDLDFITQSMSKEQANKTKKKAQKGNDPELYEYNLDKLLVGKDGSAILIGEQFYVQTVTSTINVNGWLNSTYAYHYYYNDIIAVKISPDGQIQWAQKVPKIQHTINDEGFYSSYSLAIVKGKICFIFNDAAGNLEYKGGQPIPYFGGWKSVVVIASINQNGEVIRQPLFKNDIEVITRPKVCEQISNSEVILFGQHKRTQQFAKLMFD